MAHISRHELKQDQLRTTFEDFEEFTKKRYKEILTVAGIVILVAGLAGGLKVYQDRQEAEANAQLGMALRTFRAYVGPTPPDNLLRGIERFPTSRDKYKKALGEFQELIQRHARFPQPKAVAIARYHVGLCQAQLGDREAAIKTLQEASRNSDRNLAALAQFALAGELLRAGKLEDATRLYGELAERPTSTVPEVTARLALADAYRATQPAKARQIYAEIEKRFGADAVVAQVLKEQVASLPK